jgi:hypothetical protein
MKNDSVAYSIYKVVPFAKLWNDFKVEAEGATQKI